MSMPTKKIAVAILTLAVLSGGIAGGLALAGRGADAKVAAADKAASAVSSQGTPLPLDAATCGRATQMLQSSRERARIDMTSRGMPGVDIAQMEADFADSFAWVGAGCPADPVRGFYPSSDGKGGNLQLLANSSWGGHKLDGSGQVVVVQR